MLEREEGREEVGDIGVAFFSCQDLRAPTPHLLSTLFHPQIPPCIKVAVKIVTCMLSIADFER